MPSGSTSERRPWFPFFPLDWLNSTRVRKMGSSARGIYLEALCLQWIEGSLPVDLKSWRRLFRDGSDSDLQEVMAAFPGGRNERLERERRIADEIGLRRGQASRKANSVRWGSESDPNRIRKTPHRQVQVQKNPPTPLGGKRAARAAPAALVLSPTLEPARKSVEDWLAYKAEKRKPYRPKGLEALLRRLESWGPSRVKAAVEHSMASGWDGLYEPGLQPAVKGPTSLPPLPVYVPDPTPRNTNPPKLLELFASEKAKRKGGA